MSSYIVTFAAVERGRGFSGPVGKGFGFLGDSMHLVEILRRWGRQGRRAVALQALLRSPGLIRVGNWEQIPDFTWKSIMTRFVPLEHGLFGVPLLRNEVLSEITKAPSKIRSNPRCGWNPKRNMQAKVSRPSLEEGHRLSNQYKGDLGPQSRQVPSLHCLLSSRISFE